MLQIIVCQAYFIMKSILHMSKHEMPRSVQTCMVHFQFTGLREGENCLWFFRISLLYAIRQWNQRDCFELDMCLSWWNKKCNQNTDKKISWKVVTWKNENMNLMKDGRCSLKKIINVETNLLIMDADKTTFIQGT